jgi:quercetin dioxygenase-like cupin family protein
MDGLMYRVHRNDLPFRGSSHHFVGERNAGVGISSFLFNGSAGAGPGPHRHPYDEIQFILEGRARYVVDGAGFEAGAGDILVIKAGEVNCFNVIGDTNLVQVDVHESPRFIQENLQLVSVTAER